MANTTERIGVSYCSLIAAKTEWMFREQPIDDIGIDAHCYYDKEEDEWIEVGDSFEEFRASLDPMNRKDFSD